MTPVPPRVRLPFPTWEDFLGLGVDEVTHYGVNDPTVRTRVQTLLEDLIELAPPERLAPLRLRREALRTVLPEQSRA